MGAKYTKGQLAATTKYMQDKQIIKIFPKKEKVLVYCIIDISLNNLPVFPSNCVDFAQRCHRIASFSRLVDEKTFCVI